MTKVASFARNEIILGLPGGKWVYGAEEEKGSCSFNRKELLCEYLK